LRYEYFGSAVDFGRNYNLRIAERKDDDDMRIKSRQTARRLYIPLWTEREPWWNQKALSWHGVKVV
jgi:hypothetical protein